MIKPVLSAQGIFKAGLIYFLTGEKGVSDSAEISDTGGWVRGCANNCSREPRWRPPWEWLQLLGPEIELLAPLSDGVPRRQWDSQDLSSGKNRARHAFGIIHQEMLVEGGKLKELDEEDSIKSEGSKEIKWGKRRKRARGHGEEEQGAQE